MESNRQMYDYKRLQIPYTICDPKYVFRQFSKSQLQQDLNVINHYNHKRRGYFVEIGANDGVKLSNTYLLETQFNWKGICVEPILSTFQELKVNRPNSICVEKAVYNRSNMLVDFYIYNDDTLYSGISDHLTSHKSMVENNKTWDKTPTITLLDLLDEAKAPKFIEYLSLDTEGSEYEILKAFDFSKYEFGIIDVEHNFIEPQRSQIRELLEANGYIYNGANQWDDNYVIG
jgi:FkbM family methyltransferase